MTRREYARLRETIVKALIYATCALIGAAMFAIVLLEWAVGCGEVQYFPDNTWQTGECLFIPHEQKSGTW